MFLQQVSYNSGSFSNPFQLFRLLTLKMYIWARCSISALFLLLVHVFKNKKKLLSKSACFSCPCSKTPSYPSPPAVCQALLGVSAQSKIPSLKWVSQMSIFQKVADIQQIQSCFFSAPFLTKSIVLLCLNHCLYENKCNGFSAKLVFNSLATLKLQGHLSSGVLKYWNK